MVAQPVFWLCCLLLRPAEAQVVVVADGATATERWAAAKLSQLLPKGLSTELAAAAAAAGAPGARNQIAVGHGAAVALGVDPEALAALGDDAYLIVSGPARGVPAGSVAIASSAQSRRGTMNGAFAFLRRLGFDFLAQDETVVPGGAPALPPGLHISYDPPFENREMAAVPTAGPGGTRGKGPAFPPGQDLVRLATNLSAALGFDGPTAYAPVGGKVGPLSPPGFTASIYNLLAPGGSGSVFACGPGEQNATQKYLPCPAVVRDHPEWFACMIDHPDDKSNPYPYGNHVNHAHTVWPCPKSGPHSVAPDGKPGGSQPW